MEQNCPSNGTRVSDKVAQVDAILAENPYRPVVSACREAGISRSSYYRLKGETEPTERPLPPNRMDLGEERAS